MTFAGAIELDPGAVFLILAMLAVTVSAFAALGGAVAVWIAGRRQAFWLGAAAAGGTAILLARSLSVGPAALTGLGASALVGWHYREDRPGRHDEPS